MFLLYFYTKCEHDCCETKNFLCLFFCYANALPTYTPTHTIIPDIGQQFWLIGWKIVYPGAHIILKVYADFLPVPWMQMTVILFLVQRTGTVNRIRADDDEGPRVYALIGIFCSVGQDLSVYLSVFCKWINTCDILRGDFFTVG